MFSIAVSGLLPDISLSSSFESNEVSLFEEGMALNNLRRFDEALLRFKEAIRTDLENHRYHKAIFMTYISPRKGLQGLKFYEEFSAEHPTSSTVHYWLGRFYLQSGALEKSAKSFEEAARLRPGDEHPWISLGHVRSRLGQDTRALKAYREADRLIPDIPIVKAGIGKVYFNRKEYTKARVAYEAAIEKDPALMDARFELSLIYEKEGEFAKAIHEWKEILESNPNELRARKKLAGIFYKGEQYLDAFQEYSLLSKLLPNDPKVYLALGESQVMLATTVGDSEGKSELLAGAAEAFQHALDFDPDNDVAKTYLNRLKKK